MQLENKISRDNKGNWMGATGTYVVLFMALGAMTFFGVCSPRDPQGGLGGIAASVNHHEVTNAEFSRAYKSYSERLRSQYGDDFNPQALKVAKTVMDQLISSRIVWIEASKLGLGVSDNEVVHYLNSIDAFRDEKGTYSEEVFRNYLRNNRYTESAFLEEMKRNLATQKLRQFMGSTAYVSSLAAEIDFRLEETKYNVDYLKIEPSKQDINIDAQGVQEFLAQEGAKDKVKNYFDSHQTEFNVPEKIKASHILISFKDARTAPESAKTRSKDEAKSKAEAVLVRLKAGEDFATVAKAETDEPNGKVTGGDLGFFAFENMVPEFSEVAFKLASNELSGVVETPFGFHIIKAMDKQAAVKTDLDQATDKIVRDLIKKEKAPIIAKENSETILASLQKGEDVTELLKASHVEWQTTGEFPANTKYAPGLGSNQTVVEGALALSDTQKLSPAVLRSGNNFFILRLKEKKLPDMKTFDEKRREQMAYIAASTQGYSLYQSFESQLVDDYETSKSIYRNPSYLALDQQQTPQ